MLNCGYLHSLAGGALCVSFSSAAILQVGAATRYAHLVLDGAELGDAGHPQQVERREVVVR